MKTRAFVAAVGLLLVMVAIPSSVVAKEASVALEISGMT